LSNIPFSIGRQCSLVFIGPFGRVDLATVTGFDPKQRTHKVGSRPLNGPPLEYHLPDGWEGEIHLDRGSSAADDLIAQIEAGYWASGDLGNSTVYQYVQEGNGSTSTYQFDGAQVNMSQSGHWKADGTVKQTLSFYAATRRRVS